MKNTVFFGLFFILGSSLLSQVTANQPDPIILCDTNNPGDQMEIFDLTIREPQIIGSQNNVVVTYHLTSGDALGNGGFIEDPENFENTSDPQNIFIRVENINNSNDWEITVLELIVPFIPEIMTPAQDIIMDDPNGDGMEVFDLTRDEGDVLGSQDPFEFTISYFETQADADSNTNPISNPENYTNLTNPQTIYTRFAPLQDQCQYETYSFDIIAENTLSQNDENSHNFKIYPNPVNDRLFVKASQLGINTTLEIYSINGSLVSSQLLDAHKSDYVDTEMLTSGIYMIRITSEGKVNVKRLIKK